MASSPPPTITIYLSGPLRAYSGGATQLMMSAHTVRAALEDLERSQSALYRNVCDATVSTLTTCAISTESTRR